MFARCINTCLLLAFVGVAHASERVPPDWPEVGRAKLEVLWFDIYNAALHAPEGVFAGFSAPLLLQVNYLRDFKGKDLVTETDKQMQPFSTQTQREQWLPQLLNLWPDIKKGDQLAFEITPSGEGHFYYNQRWLGVVSDPGFAEAFVKIWLANESEYPELASQLRGQNR
ncbi:chalcone isomerase family protein [Neptuniibacter sp. CAU 1671]|uniref:chalcone isomerase family protein n=1 Tax=Neptuniibacter sp. CAU 1671 TaxID=3032593 RepID=UPI0023DB337D|nr:chalcone isomerase family protein [Neptuniibacter sp. CAU 1671]MDF2182833.1 chalcone isomerase family protein [Neptuniibacter sp. CAU 1671]